MRKRGYTKRILAIIVAAAMVLAEPLTVFAEPSGPASMGTESADGGSVSPDSAENTDDAAMTADNADGEDAEDASDSGTDKDQDADHPVIKSERIEHFETITGDASDLPDNDELLDGYITKQFEEQMVENGVADDDEPKHNRFDASVPRGDRLTGNDKVAYNFLKDKIEKVAKGEISNTEFIIPADKLWDKTEYTAAELGYDYIYNGSWNEAAIDAFYAKVPEPDVVSVINALLADCSYDLFWYDKTKGYNYGYTTGITGNYYSVAGQEGFAYRIRLRVASEYATGEAIGSFSVDTSKIDAVNSTVANAQAVVNAAKSKSTDYLKLIYYRNWICENVAYNKAAAGSSSTPYGNLWQLIWAFDNDSSTKIVCEGYSKAFKWLFDLTDFDSDLMECYLVDGVTSGNHMWNTVRMDDGEYYLADLTNCDSDNEYGIIFSKFFLGGYTGKVSDRYTYYAREDYPGGYTYKEVSYTYNDYMYQLYPNGELDVSGTDYVPSSVQPVVKYTVSFNANGHGTAPASQKVKEGNKVTKPAAPSADGYDFGGWYTEQECRDEWDFSNDTVDQDMTLWAKWTPKDMTLTYYANGGTGSMTPASGKYGSDVTVSSCGFSRTGYHFVKWNTKSDGTGTSYNPGDKYTMGVTGNDLYAVWEKNNYTVSFNSMGGSNVASVEVAYNEKITQPADPTKTGYTFAGWYKEPSCGTKWSFSNNTVTADTTLYAKWTPVKYTVTFDTKGGSAIASQQVEYKAKAVRPTGVLTKTGYTFDDWYKDSGCKVKWDFGSEEITGPATIYAGWTINKYTVTFNSNGGSSVSSQQVEYGKFSTEPSPAPEKEGYDFAGWYKNSSLTNPWKFDEEMIKDNMTVYAKWTVKKYTVSFNTMGGSSIGNVSVEHNKTVTKPATPTKTGHEFVAWYKEPDYKTEWLFNSFKITGPTTIYAKWKARSYDVTFATNGGSSVAKQSVEFNKKASRPDPDPEKEGYSFAGWYKESSCDTVWDFEEDVIRKATIIYAKWTPKKYMVSFDTNGGSSVSGQMVEYNTKATRPTADPIKTGHDFENWYKDAACKTLWRFDSDVITKETTIYAKWTPKKYTVSFDTAGGSGVADQTVEYNKNAARPAADPTKEGHTFAGWYKDAGCSTPWDFENGVITGPTTIYAGWTINKYTVTFNSNGGSSVSSQQVEYGKFSTEPSPAPEKEGYILKGWFKDPQYKEGWDFNNDAVTKDTTVYAKWEKTFTGWKKDENGVWKYIENGIEVKNRFVTAGGSTYYLKDDGSRAVGKTVLTLNGEKTFYFNRKGVMQTGWISDGTGKHYYDPANGGAMAVSKWTGEGKNRVYVDEDGNRHAAGSANIDDNEYYFDSNGQVKTGWIKVSDKWCYFNPAEDNYGAKIKAEAGKGTQQFVISGKTYLVNESGERLTGWQGDKYYDANGVLITGWKKIDGDWYYFYPDDTSKDGEGRHERGDKATGLAVVDGKLYSFGTDGRRAGAGENVTISGNGSQGGNSGSSNSGTTNRSGVVKVDQSGFVKTADGSEVYVDTSGRVAKNEWVTIAKSNDQGATVETRVYVGSDGKKETGLTRINGMLYGLDEDGNLQKSGWYKYDENEKKLVSTSGPDKDAVYVNPDGTVRTGWGNDGFYYGDNGKRVTNTVTKIGRKLYGFDDDGSVLTQGMYSVNDGKIGGALSIGNATYFVRSDGTLVTGWFKDEATGNSYYFSAENGTKLTGVHKIGTDRYYFTDRDGDACGTVSMNEGWITDKYGRSYYVSDKGTIKTGWFENDGKSYYLGKDGELLTDRVIKAGTKLYYQEATGIVKASAGRSKEIISRGGKKYAVNEKGVLQTGWQTIGGKKYCFDKTTGCALTGTQQVKGVWYTFDSDGKLI